MKNKLTILFLAFSVIALTFLSSCEEIYEPITVTGRVIDTNTESPVANATVSIVLPEDLAMQTISNSSGEFVFEEVAVDSVIDLTLEAQKEGFSSGSITTIAAPERELSVPDIRIRNQQSGGDDEVTGETGGAANIELVNLESQSIRIDETGGAGNSAFTFVVLDSTGRAINAQNAVDVRFRITEGPKGGETITPEVVRSNANGEVTSNIFAGNVAGNLKIEALIERTDIGLTIRSKPILLTIHGGFPDLEHFSIAADIYNFEAYTINGNRNEITVIVGDKYSNPVKEGTPVYFNTTHGVIQGSGVTNADGEVTVDLISGDPRPPAENAISTIRAYTFDENDVEITREIPVLFSGPPASNRIQVTPTTFDIGPGGSQTFTMTVTDENGNPLPYNTQISVSPSDGMTLDGEVDITVPNTLSPGPGVTEFTFSAQDSDDESNESQNVSILIEVETPGGYRATKTISGTKAKSAFN
ncbi:carboxypeptidase regulatory-like domain-containing protein [Rhodohalobacter sulfatireducens]|uniref:Ig-like domain-containing protein n=1 Tax=Rhodohalobacter sulfatireducens TaxID=2911366 RepID=A0ABS9KDY5_9BACT|nr:Ig-like domain-containing protein [Rhodohalobacter sulfatireducens]MCG2589069.1 Ig-like domain-containing protein [Rhodohalobacter sulfatireducens]